MSIHTLYSKEELQAKGLKRSDIVRVMKTTERECNYFFKLHISRALSAKEQSQWDNANCRWDHFKATLNAWDK